MPVLKKIVIQNFRNIELQELEFSGKLNCITGGNGEGKTNLLDAIWYLSMSKSAFGADRFNIRYGAESFSLSGTYALSDGRLTKIAVQVGEEKKIRRDDKTYSRIAEHIGLLPIVMVSPSDTALVSDSGEQRRRFVNAVLSQTDASYLSGIQQYGRLLAQRNSLLKTRFPDEGLLDVLDDRLSETAAPLALRRKAFAQDINPGIKEFYSRISGGKESVGIEYRSEIVRTPLRDLLRSRRELDFRLGYTTAGLQRDDFVFRMNGHAIRNCGSQGQQKSFLVALKFAQYSLMKTILGGGTKPILLLDDLFDKLDPERVENLLKMVSGDDFGQIFISDSNKHRISAMVDSIVQDRAYFEAAGGVFARL